MLLTVDIGNTNIVLGLYDGDDCIHFWRIASDARRTSDEYSVLIRRLLVDSDVNALAVTGVVVGSVVPVLSLTMDTALEAVTSVIPFRVTHDVKLPVKNKYAKPREVGIDRIANAAGGIQLFGAPLIVVDLGTAITLDVITEKKEYLGGAILPGIEMSAQALSERTARLPLASAVPVERAIGRTTIHSIRSGIINGMTGAIDYLVEQIWKELGYKTGTVATGGFAPVLIKNSKHVKNQNAELTLLGLKMIYEMNHSSSKRGSRKTRNPVRKSK